LLDLVYFEKIPETRRENWRFHDEQTVREIFSILFIPSCFFQRPTSLQYLQYVVSARRGERLELPWPGYIPT
jgi:hypothetical protein